MYEWYDVKYYNFVRLLYGSFAIMSHVYFLSQG